MQQRKKARLRFVQNLVDRLFCRKTVIFNFLVGADDLPQHRFFLDDRRVAADIDRDRHGGGQVADKLRACHFSRRILCLERFQKRYNINRLPFIVKPDDRLKHQPVLPMVEIVPRQHLHRDEDRFLVIDHCADDRLLGRQALRHLPDYGFFVHRNSPQKTLRPDRLSCRAGILQFR